MQGTHDDRRETELERTAKEAIMHSACASALTGVTLKHGGPFGACVVRNGIFISMAHNTVLHDGDPTCHAEMNAIRYACKALGTHDLSDCELYTTCEPCPMCYGSIGSARISKVYTGVDRFIAAKYGFDDKVFYDEFSAQSGHWAVKQEGEEAPIGMPAMLKMFYGIEKERIHSLVSNMRINRTYRRRFGERSIGFHDEGKRFGEDVIESLHLNVDSEESEAKTEPEHDGDKYMALLEKAIQKAISQGRNKEREVFGSLVVKDGQVISVSVNEVLHQRDATATSEVLAIREAAEKLGTYNLEGCVMYSTFEPCVMSLGAILWARIGSLYYGLSQHAAARYGFEEGLLQYRELFAEPHITDTIRATERFVGVEACEKVFEHWSEINGVIY